MSTALGFPFRIDGRGRAASADDPQHVRQMMEQLLFTSPGDRVNRPELGTNLSQLLFAPASDEVITATEFMVQAALQRWMSDLIQVDQVSVRLENERLVILISYLLKRQQERHVAQLIREV